MGRPSGTKHKIWSAEELKFLVDTFGQYSYQELAEQFNCSRPMVFSKIGTLKEKGIITGSFADKQRELGLSNNKGKYWMAEEDSILTEYYLKEPLMARIMEALPGRTLAAITNRAKTLGLVSNIGIKRLGKYIEINGLYYNWCVVNKGSANYSSPYVIVNALSRGIRNKLLHRLVYETYKGPIPEQKEIHHINGNSLDNRLINLEPADSGAHQYKDRESRILLQEFLAHKGLELEYLEWAKDAIIKTNYTRANLIEEARIRGHFLLTMPDSSILQYPFKEGTWV